MRDGPLRSSTLFHLSLEVSTASGSQSMQKKFIVTGGAGFIGSAVARICPEEIAFNAGWIDRDQLIDLGERLGNSSYGHT